MTPAPGSMFRRKNGGVAERSIAPGCKLGALKGYAGSNPAPATRNEGERRAHVAQLVEHVLGKNGVTGSSPVVGSSARKTTYSAGNRAECAGFLYHTAALS